MKTLYICDGKQCKNPLYCKVKHPKNWLCAHTTNPAHAKNGVVTKPWEYPERFRKEEVENKILYIEKLEDDKRCL